MLTHTQRAALKTFLPAPAICALLALLLVATTGPSHTRWLILYNIIPALGVPIVTILLTADPVIRKAAGNRIIGALYGLFLLVIGAIAFSLPNFLYLPDANIRQCLLVPVGWICFYGWPIAAFCGILFIGACENKTTQ